MSDNIRTYRLFELITVQQSSCNKACIYSIFSIQQYSGFNKQ